MKAGAVRKLALERTLPELQSAVEAIVEREEEILEVDGDDMGERLTNLLLAVRVRERVDGGEDFKEAFRTEMASVRETLTNDS